MFSDKNHSLVTTTYKTHRIQDISGTERTKCNPEETKENLVYNDKKDPQKESFSKLKRDQNSALCSKSFDLMLNSLLNPINSLDKNDKSPLTHLEARDETFEEMIDKILTPEIQTQTNSKRKNVEEAQNSPLSCGNKKLKNSQEVEMTVSKQQKRLNTDSSETQHNYILQLGADLSFEQALSQVLSSQEEKRNLMEEDNGNDIQQRLHTSEVNISSQDNIENHSLIQCSTIPDSFAEICPKKIMEPPSDTSFDQLLCHLTLDLQDEETVLTKKDFKEMSTQTSFNEFSLPPSQSTWSNYQNNDSIRVPYIFSQNNLESLNDRHTIADSCDDRSSEAISLKNNKEEQPTENVKHILDILSRDATTLPNGHKLFNISQIGTDKWLQSAFASIRKTKWCTKRNNNVMEIFEEQNTASLYTDYVIKLDVKRYLKETTKVCELRKIDARGVTTRLSDTKQYLWEKIEDKEFSSSEVKLRQAIDEICSNSDFISSDVVLERIDKTKICIKIHNIFAKLYEAFQNRQVPVLLIRRRGDKRGCIFKNDRLQYGPLKKTLLKKVTLKTSTTRVSFCRLLYIMGKVYSLLQNKTKLTKREIFYQIKRLVTRQGNVDSSIEEATCLLGVGSWHLNITCQSGLVYGNLKLFWASGDVTDCNTSATLIPSDLEDLDKIQTDAYFILVVEKESIFRKLLEEDLPNKLARPFILLTGKGCPSINTRLFLNKISKMLALPVFILVDPDVYGIKIMLAYRFGCISSCHLSDELSVPKARWLGVFPSEIASYGMTHQELTKRDITIANSVLQYPCMEKFPQIAAELELLLSLNKKASIEGLIKNDTFLSEAYLPMKFFQQDFI